MQFSMPLSHTYNTTDSVSASRRAMCFVQKTCGFVLSISTKENKIKIVILLANSYPK